jgi:lipopolysaccharide transport system permease protein
MEKKWRETITSDNSLLRLNIGELWQYRDLLVMLVRRDFLAIYKQTILGPLWFILQPALTTIMYVLVFSRVGKLSTNGVSPVLFYLSGLVLWLFFSECILRTASFFKDNTAIFSKVYFPRLIVPFSMVLTNTIKLGIHLFLFLMVYIYFMVTDPSIRPNIYAFLFPVYIGMIGIFGLGMGIMVSSLTTRYKDLVHLVNFGVQLMMFISPVIFPLSSFAGSPLQWVILANPMTGIIEGFRYGFLGAGQFNPGLLLYDVACIIGLFLLALLTFNSVEKSFVDNI